ncbi:hypothetical protein [Paenibacillus ferrarius]|uniref:hypothetical protein n=1 Tax=Paenibacillus ferrarius TaxID=1469647 RepID=UPI003D2BE5DF
MKKINFKQIIYLNKDKLEYISETGIEEEILFQDCSDNYRKQNSNIVNNCVGVRDITANPPFIGLYSDPPLKILFNSEEEFGDFRNKIHDFDWGTLDLS